MNSYNVIQTQAKSIKSTWLNSHVIRSGRVWFQGAKKCQEKVKNINALVFRVVSDVLRQNKRAKYTSTKDSGSEDDPDKFNFKIPNIREE